MSSSTIKALNTGHDYQKVAIIKDALLNPLTTAARTTLGGGLGSGNKGLFVWDTDLSTIYVWDGSAWATPTSPQSGLTPKGNKHFNDTEPGSPVIGDLYVFDTAGTNTWNASDEVQIGDQAYWDGTIWQFIQGNTIAASSTIQGVVELATDAETITGTDTVRATTPANVAAREASRKVARVYFASGVSLVADTPFTVNHALAIQNRDAFTINVMVGNSQVDVDVDSTDTNNLTVTSSKTVTAAITVIGF